MLGPPTAATATQPQPQPQPCLVPGRVALQLHAEHRSLLLSTGDTRFVKLAEPFASGASTVDDIISSTRAAELVSKAITGYQVAVMTARMG
eukprot:jgi/Hompol1/6746/HPOL_005064-RA